MNEVHTSSRDDPAVHRWVVQFEPRFGNSEQQAVFEQIGVLAYAVIRTWLDVLTPGAIVFEPHGMPVRSIIFPYRSQMRRFIKTFGGRQVRRSKRNQ